MTVVVMTISMEMDESDPQDALELAIEYFQNLEFGAYLENIQVPGEINIKIADINREDFDRPTVGYNVKTIIEREDLHNQERSQ